MSTAVGQIGAQRRGWTRYQAYLVFILLAVSICNYVDRGILPLLQELLKAELKLRDGDLGLLTGPFFACFYALSAIPLARLAERFNRVRLLAGMVALWSGMTALCGLASNLPSLIAFRLGVGFAEGGGVPVSHSLLSDNFPQRQRGLAMAVLSAAQPTAAMIAPIIGATIATVWGCRAAFVTVGLSGMVLALPVLMLREPRDAKRSAVDASSGSDGPRSLIADVRWLFANKAYRWLFVAGAFMGMGNGGVGVFLVSYLMRAHERTLVEAGSVLGLIGAMGLVGTLIGGYAADRFAGERGRSYPLVCAIGALAAAILYLAAFAQAAWLPAAGLILAAGVATDLKNGPNFAAVQNIAPARMRATAAGVYMLGPTLIGFSIGPPLSGFLSDAFASFLYAGPAGTFETLCGAGRGGLKITEACRAASAAGLTTALTIVTFAYFGAALAFYICSRSFNHRAEAEGSVGLDRSAASIEATNKRSPTNAGE
jgi:predicted MFS family arabinose efflux permease